MLKEKIQIMLLGVDQTYISKEYPWTSSANISEKKKPKLEAGKIKVYDYMPSNIWVESMGEINGESGEINKGDSHSHTSSQNFHNMFLVVSGDIEKTKLLEILNRKYSEYFDSNMNTIFKKDRDLKIGYAIIDLMKQREDIENFNKKALYILIREMTDVETAHITSVVNVLKRHYKKLLNTYHKNGTIIHNFSGSFF